MAWTEIPLADASLRYCDDWLPGAEADVLLTALDQGIAWQQHRLRLFGKLHDAPRLSCWIGDPDAAYRYSGTCFIPQPWPPLLAELRAQLALALDVPFNSVLANLYRDGSDAMGWHSDDESELGLVPVIASISLGAERRLLFKRKQAGARALGLPLAHGSLLVMAGATQKHYRHALPRTAKVTGARINLTFRQICG